MDIDKLSSTEQLRPDQRELADIIGLDAYKKLIHHYGGNQLYIQQVDSVLRDLRQGAERKVRRQQLQGVIP